MSEPETITIDLTELNAFVGAVMSLRMNGQEWQGIQQGIDKLQKHIALRNAPQPQAGTPEVP